MVLSCIDAAVAQSNKVFHARGELNIAWIPVVETNSICLLHCGSRVVWHGQMPKGLPDEILRQWRAGLLRGK